MENIFIASFVVGWLIALAAFVYAAKSMFTLYANILPGKKGWLLISGPFVFALANLYEPSVRKHIPRLWLSIIIFIGMCVGLYSWGSACAPSGIGSWQC
jgi:hypothetical protein